ncbi:hypothetical protein B0H11DRAFT_2097100 [Mycena galericulata]|nr:hypothetical protein B0H11DRAFT_2097100 [Mycena galericulata]
MSGSSVHATPRRACLLYGGALLATLPPDACRTVGCRCSGAVRLSREDAEPCTNYAAVDASIVRLNSSCTLVPHHRARARVETLKAAFAALQGHGGSLRYIHEFERCIDKLEDRCDCAEISAMRGGVKGDATGVGRLELRRSLFTAFILPLRRKSCFFCYPPNRFTAGTWQLGGLSSRCRRWGSNASINWSS